MNHLSASANDMLRVPTQPSIFQSQSPVELLVVSAAPTQKSSAPVQHRPESVLVTISATHRLQFTPNDVETPIHNIHLRNIRMAVSLSAGELTLYLGDKSVLQLRFDAATEVDHVLAHLRYLLGLTYANYPIVRLQGSTVADVQSEVTQRQHPTSAGTSSVIEPSSPENSLTIAVWPNERFNAMMMPNYSNFQPDGPAPGGPCGSLSRAYAAMCDYFGGENLSQIEWYIDSVFTRRQQFKVFSLQDFPGIDMSGRDVAPLIYALQWDKYFEALHIIDAGKVCSEAAQALAAVMLKNSTLKEVKLNGVASMPKDFIGALTEAATANLSTRLVSLDLSLVPIDDKGATALASVLHRLPNGLSSLRLADCNLSKKAASQILSSLKKAPGKESGSTTDLQSTGNQQYQKPLVDSLLNLDLSKNAISSDAVLALSDFLAQPNRLRKLALSHCSIPNVEVLFGALVRGCAQELCELDLEGNRFSSSDSAASSFGQFFRSCQRLHIINFGATRLPGSYLNMLITSLRDNSSKPELTLKLSANDFGLKEAKILHDSVEQLDNLVSLDLSDNHFEGDDGLAHVFKGIKSHQKLATLRLDRVLSKSSAHHSAPKSKSGTTKLVRSLELSTLLGIPQLRTLSVAENNSKYFVRCLLKSLSDEDGEQTRTSNLRVLDIRGNNIGDTGAFFLAMAIQHTSSLVEVMCGDNDFSIVGWSHVAVGLERNRTIRSLPVSASEMAAVSAKPHQIRGQALFRELDKRVTQNASTGHHGAATSPVMLTSTGLQSPQHAETDATLQRQGIEDVSLSLTQQESLEKHSAALRTLVQLLVSEEKSQSASSADTVKFANKLIENVANTSTTLTQLGLLAEESVQRQLTMVKSQASNATGSLVDLGQTNWEQVKDSVANLLATELPLTMSSAGSSLDGNNHTKITMLLKKVFQLGTTFNLGEGDFSRVLQATFTQEYSGYLLDGVNSLLNIVKNLVFEKAIGQLERSLAIVKLRIEEIEKDAAGSNGGDHADNRNSNLARTLRDIKANGLDLSSLSASSELVRTPPLNHLTKRSGHAGRRMPSPVTRTVPMETADSEAPQVPDRKKQPQAMVAQVANSPPQVAPRSISMEKMDETPPPLVAPRRRPSQDTAAKLPPAMPKPSAGLGNTDLPAQPGPSLATASAEPRKPTANHHDKPADVNVNTENIEKQSNSNSNYEDSERTEVDKKAMRNQLNNLLLQPKPSSERPSSASTPQPVVEEDAQVPSVVEVPPTPPPVSTKPAPAQHDDNAVKGAKNADKKKQKTGTSVAAKLGGLFKRKDKKKDDESPAESEDVSDAESPMPDKKPVATATAPVTNPAQVTAATPSSPPEPFPKPPPRTVAEDTAKASVNELPAMEITTADNEPHTPAEESPAPNKKKFMTATPFAGIALNSVQLRTRVSTDTTAADKAKDANAAVTDEPEKPNKEPSSDGQLLAPAVPARPAIHKPSMPSPLAVEAGLTPMMELKPKPSFNHEPAAKEVDGDGEEEIAAAALTHKFKVSSNPMLNSSDGDEVWRNEALTWAQAHLGRDHTPVHANIIDLVQDGVSLCELVKKADKEQPFPKFKANAVLPVHKLDNLNILVNFTKIPGVTGEELLNGDVKFVSVYLAALMKKYPIDVTAT